MQEFVNGGRNLLEFVPLVNFVHGPQIGVTTLLSDPGSSLRKVIVR
jgi:hypothetical protein